MSPIEIQRWSRIKKQHGGSHFFAFWSAEMNDDFSGPTGMDAQRADGDRDVAWARGLKHRDNEDNAPGAKSWGRPCRPGDKFPW